MRTTPASFDLTGYGMAGHPTDMIFLTCDAFGVLPPVSALSPAHAMYHFISGIIDAIHDGSLAKAKTERDPVFGFEVIAECPGVPSEILIPRNAWANKATFETTAKKLAGLFNKNFETYAAGVNAEVKASAPKA